MLKTNEAGINFLEYGKDMKMHLSSGMTYLLKANLENGDNFHLSLFNLSKGLEKLLMTLIALDYAVSHDQIPTENEIWTYGSTLEDLYDALSVVSKKYGFSIPERKTLESSTQSILSLISDFANTSKLATEEHPKNLNEMNDFINRFSQILNTILEQDIPTRTKNNLLLKAGEDAPKLLNKATDLKFCFDSENITGKDAHIILDIQKKLLSYANLHVTQILGPLDGLIMDFSYLPLKDECRSVSIPAMHEFLNWLTDDKQIVLSKRKWS
jgi:hypothetical protein